MNPALKVSTLVDAVLDRSIVLGYGTTGLAIRRRLPGWPDDPPRMDGKVVVVTGAASGIGLAAAAGFARLGARVYLTARSRERADDAARAVRGAVPMVCDVSSLASLWRFVAEFTDREGHLDVLVNNAGVMPGERERTADGVELTFATHVLGPWFLTDRLTGVLRAAAPSRVINVVSGGQYAARIPAGDPQSDQAVYRPKTIYARTKREQLVLSEMWAARLADDGVVVHATHPGWADTKGVRTSMPLFSAITRPIIRTAEQGADTVVWLGAAPEALRTGGLFWHDRKPRPTTYLLGAAADGRRSRAALWDHVRALAAQHDAPETVPPAPGESHRPDLD